MIQKKCYVKSIKQLSTVLVWFRICILWFIGHEQTKSLDNKYIYYQ
jgi:hypothetical protein